MRGLSAKLTEGEIQRANEPHSTFSYYREILSRLRRERINDISRQKDFAFSGARPKALPLETANFLKKVGSKAFSDSFHVTENGGQLRYLAPGQAPKAVFELGSEKPVAVYAYCNLHGLWMTKL